MVYLDYGFDLERLRGRERDADEPFTFAYIGTHKVGLALQKLQSHFGFQENEHGLILFQIMSSSSPQLFQVLFFQLLDIMPYFTLKIDGL